MLPSIGIFNPVEYVKYVFYFGPIGGVFNLTGITIDLWSKKLNLQDLGPKIKA